MSKETRIAAAIVSVVFGFVGFCFGGIYVLDKWGDADLKFRSEAVEQGHAEFYLDENHNRHHNLDRQENQGECHALEKARSVPHCWFP